MKKTLYITDLDGTLLNGRKEIPGEACKILSELIQSGRVDFSVATARTPATTEVLLKDLKINRPVVLMNGAAIYDMEAHCYQEVAYISGESVTRLMAVCSKELEGGFVYAVEGNRLLVYYQDLSREERNSFFEERQGLKYKTFIKGKPQELGSIAYFVFIDGEEKIKAINRKLDEVPNIARVMYRDIYSEEGWILEVYSDEATKANGIKKLKKLGQYDEIVCFGDNYNDLSMFEASDRAYAVSNAAEAVKDQADGVIGSCEEGSVASFILKEVEGR